MSERRPWGEEGPDGPHVWRTLGYRGEPPENGQAVIEWDASEEYSFPADSGPILHGGLVTTVLDTAMGGACWSLLEEGETFLTADLRVEFFRPARPGKLRAEGRVVHRTKRIVFCAAEAFDTERNIVAAARCTQILRTAR
jgi:uncharacterized protein (TIGR00369 family)